jgi:steroid delta-isomerase-like uncharacterized protein
MSQANIQRALRWFEELWNQHRSDVIDELLTPESVGHMEGGDVVGGELFKQVYADFLAAFPDIRVDVESVLAEGDEVAVRWYASGRHSGDGFGVKATHEHVSFRGVTWIRCQDGKFVEGWDCWNQQGLVQRLRDAELRGVQA